MAHAERRTRIDDIARKQFNNGGHVGHDVGNAKDHVAGLRVLTLFTIYGATKLQVIALVIVCHVGDPWSDWGVTNAALAQTELWWSSHVLQSAVRHVLSCAQTRDVIPCSGFIYMSTAFANNDDQFRLVVNGVAQNFDVASWGVE